MVAATAEGWYCNMTAAEADTFKIMSTMTEVAEATMPTETRKVALKMVSEAPKTLEAEAGDLNFMESESGATTETKVSTEGGGGGLPFHFICSGGGGKRKFQVWG